MAMANDVPEATVVSGDRRIEEMLQEKGSIVIPARSCRFDGFMNDTSTEYANASIYRPYSVSAARLVSTVSSTLYHAGRHYLGFTMYAAAGCDERVEVWIGHRQVALARLGEPDNRVHLFVAPAPFRFRGGEPVRLVTAPTSGAYRIENLVLLPRRPKPTEEALEIQRPHVDLRFTEDGLRGYVTWITNRPTTGLLSWGRGTKPEHEEELVAPVVNHGAVTGVLERGKTYGYRIEMTGVTGGEAAFEGQFDTDVIPPRSRWKSERVPLLVRRAARLAAPWPVSVGVPFPPGALGSENDLRLLGAEEDEIPMQARKLAEWPDGSVKWALVDFQAQGPEDVVLECGRNVARAQPEAPLETVEDESKIVVTTGPIRVEIPKDRVLLPGIVSARQADGSYRRLTPTKTSRAATLVDDAGNEYQTGRPDAVVVEEPGPERVCIRIEARHRSRQGRSLFRSTFRVHVFRGSGAIRVLHTFENDETSATFSSIRELRLRADLGLGTQVNAGLERLREVPVGKRPLRLHQTHDNHYQIRKGRRVLAKGRRAHGAVDLSGDGGGVSVVVRNFWQNYPKAIGLDAGGVTLEICPPLSPDAYPQGGELEDRLYYYLLDGAYKLKYGVARTHEFWFHFRPAEEKPPKGFRECVQTPPLYSVSLATFNESEAITQLPAKQTSPYPPYERWVEAVHDAYPKDRELWQAYGMLNFGDWFGERAYNWGNQEYDAAWCFLQEYLRGGHPDFYTWAEEAAYHLVDVDTCHHSANPGDVGGQYAHCVGHVGGYYPDGYREKATFSSHFTVSHTWVEGPLLYHLLSGDTRVLECAMETADRLTGSMLNYYDFTNCRTSGWHLIHLSAAYKATGRRVFLNAARIIVERVLERQRPSGGWDRLMVPGHCWCVPPRHTGNAGFMVGVLMVGLKRYYEATGESRVAEAIVRAADYCIESMWVPEKCAFRYTSCPHSAPGGGADMRILKGVAFAWHYSRKKRFREILLAGVRTAITGRAPQPHRGFGKGVCSPMRGAPQVVLALPRPRKGGR